MKKLSNRVTISLDENVEKDLRRIQAEFLANKLTSVSFTEVVNSLLKEAIDLYKTKVEEERLGQIYGK